jgi:chemotaxis protein MotA
VTTFVGIIFGAGLLFYAIVMQGGVGIFWNIPSLMIVGGGTFAALVISFPLPRILKVVGVLLQIFKKDLQKPSWVIKLMVELSFKARQKSLLALEQDLKDIENRVIRLGMELVVDGQPANIIREVLETELDSIQTRHHSGEIIFRQAAKFAPSFGMIGTLIGLVAMLRGLGSSDDTAAAIGSGMAVALITTFYGSMMANLFFTPIAEKLRSRSDDEMLVNRIAIEGLLMIQGGVNPRIIERKLNSFLPPTMRESHYDDVLKEHRRKTGDAQRG